MAYAFNDDKSKVEVEFYGSEYDRTIDIDSLFPWIDVGNDYKNIDPDFVFVCPADGYVCAGLRVSPELINNSFLTMSIMKYSSHCITKTVHTSIFCKKGTELTFDGQVPSSRTRAFDVKFYAQKVL